MARRCTDRRDVQAFCGTDMHDAQAMCFMDKRDAQEILHRDWTYREGISRRKSFGQRQ
ncbi:hypothetical protein HAX54_040992, partial [Datura stramonium]|nr:hypothetical protein [Datura stramonium]